MSWDFLLVLEVILGFGLLIFVHELGHFLAAKWVGVRVEKFSLGFGRKLFGVKKGNTEYLISAIPLGGYVKMAGEFCYEERKGDPDEFYSKTPGQRALIITAGPVMNLAFGIPAAMLVFLLGINQPSTLCDVREGSPAYDAGLRPGIRVLAVNGEPVLSFFELRTGVLLAAPGEPIKLEYVDNDGKTKTLEIATSTKDRELGLEPYRGTTVYEVESGSPAEKAGLRPGDRIVAVDDKQIRRWEEFAAIEESSFGKTLALTVERPKPGNKTYPEYEALKVQATLGTRTSYGHGMNLSFVALPVVGEPQRGSPAKLAGLVPGDIILSIDSAPVRTWDEMREIVSASAGKDLRFAIKRQDKTFDVKIVPALEGKRGIIGITPGSFVLSVKEVTMKDGPAARAGLLPGDIIDAVNGKPFRMAKEGRLNRIRRSWLGKTADQVDPWLNESLFVQLLEENQGKPLRFSFRRGAEGEISKEDTVTMASVATETGHLGVKQGVETILRRYGLWASFQQSFPATNRVIRDTVMSIYRLVSGGLSPNMIGGPAGIATVLFYKAQEGFSQFVHLLFIISVNLALINLLPIPILDGGHLVLLTAEKFKGRPVKEKTMAALQYVGLAFLIALVLFATKNDIVNFF
jgi:regulator of sigma E protease